MTDNEQLIAQARAAHARAMNCSDLAQEGAWTAHETVNGLPPNNYWAVMAVRTPTARGVAPFKVWKAHVNTPAMATRGPVLIYPRHLGILVALATYNFPAENSPSDMAAAGGLPPLSAHDDPLNPIPKGET